MGIDPVGHLCFVVAWYTLRWWLGGKREFPPIREGRVDDVPPMHRNSPLALHTKTRQDMTRQDKTSQDKTRQDKTRQDKTRQDKARQDKTWQDKTRQDKTRQKQKQTKSNKKTNKNWC